MATSIRKRSSVAEAPSRVSRMPWMVGLFLLLSWMLVVVLPEVGGAQRPGEGDVPGESVDFRGIRSVLSDKCYQCHGPDESKRRADLRLDSREGLFEDLGGYAAVVPGKPEESEMYRRITEADPRDRMPPGTSKKSLSREEIELIRAWIAQGAEWKEHWSYVPPKRPPVPEVSDTSFVVNAIDRFVLARLKKEGLAPSPAADRITLARRVHFDLLGLPPSPAEVDAFVKDSSHESWERLVDRLLASPHYGERMALYWLDLVRYADTTGYHGDNHRDIWAYRDWVLRAFNENVPFDRLTLEQLAGDLLEGSTTVQKVASGYNRLNMTTQEGGAQPKEYVAKYAADRVRSASSVWMGATMGCAECHDHKYDPYTSRDFYRFAAFFADVKEMPIGEPGPGFPLPMEEQKAEQERLDAEITGLKRKLEGPLPELEAARKEWEVALLAEATTAPTLGEWRSTGPFQADSFDRAYETAFPPEKDPTPKEGGVRWTARPEWKDGAVHGLQGDNSATYLSRTVTVEQPRSVTLSLGSDDALKVWINGKEVLARKVQRGVAPDQEKVTVGLEAGENRLLLKVVNGGGGYGFYFKMLESGVPANIVALARVPADARTPEQESQLGAYYRGISPQLARIREEIAAKEKRKADLLKSAPTTMITTSIKPRTIRLLARGNWMDESGEVVQPGVPHFLQQIEAKGERATRLDLARWLISREHPLTARVFVNRLWKLFFGQGLARNLDDLGAQGAAPTHPELLDWLAVEFMETGWDIKRMVKLMVLSGTYRQSSLVGRELAERDPYNEHIARQSRWRLDAELVRDTALKISGLLATRLGGPSVKPPQPPGYWSHLNFPKRKYQQDQGESVHRRGLYTYWQRTFLYPSLLAFDAPTREECCAERARSNTPLQALVLLNDPVFVEAARAFAARIVREGGEGVLRRLRWAYREALSREPAEVETATLAGLLEKHRVRYKEDMEAARRLVSTGGSPVPEGMDVGELAAWTSVARVILNLYETLARN